MTSRLDQRRPHPLVAHGDAVGDGDGDELEGEARRPRDARPWPAWPGGRAGRLHGVTSFQLDATPTWGLSQSSSVMPDRPEHGPGRGPGRPLGHLVAAGLHARALCRHARRRRAAGGRGTVAHGRSVDGAAGDPPRATAVAASGPRGPGRRPRSPLPHDAVPPTCRPPAGGGWARRSPAGGEWARAAGRGPRRSLEGEIPPPIIAWWGEFRRVAVGHSGSAVDGASLLIEHASPEPSAIFLRTGVRSHAWPTGTRPFVGRHDRASVRGRCFNPFGGPFVDDPASVFTRARPGGADLLQPRSRQLDHHVPRRRGGRAA